ncbi:MULTISPECIES: GGDEF domain-containing protein [unclassified Mesorhizobium]|uniref:GGDEF domain-containing protein n=1 Tax=unclassified Mesorhizobium TaxID=325217 RepID=UPI00241585E9|nr:MULTISPECIES: GGDEF domain-containing protein [unclassified Mesorhizobium]MDG4853694.1 GGDEF domain-containing protein [Mesorhizobium sp. WSM4982]MDG4915177.1 GGDEF domain-containing protein [Mesorhizobium sp. WSM4983]
MSIKNETAPAEAWKHVVWLTLLGTAGCVGLSLGLNYLLLLSDALTPFGRSVITAALLPIIIGLPLFALLGWREVEIRRYRQELTRSGTYDHLTGCLNGAVFTSMVDRRAARPAGPRSGAFLVIHPEHLSAINLRFGLEWGDEALRLIATAIRSSVRKEDLIGRIGTAMFGVFLAGATEEDAKEIGKRVREAVGQIYFAPKGDKDVLAIRVGGVVFEHELAFEDMFRSAEEGLSELQDETGFHLSHFNN